MTKTAVVILNWNGISWLRKFLGTVVKYSSGPGINIIVADNGSGDGSADWISENYSEVKVISLEKNHGFAGGYDLALSQIEAEYFVLLNSDVEVTVGWLEPLIRFMDLNRDVASCQPKIRSFNRKEYFEYGGAAGGYIDKYGYTFCRGRIFEFVEKDEGQYDSQADIFWSTGACMVVRSEAWEKCSGFDPDFFAHMEEIDLCWRFHKAGYRVCCIPESVVYHVGGGALPYDSEFKTYLNFRNSLFLLYKNLPDNKLRKTIFIRRVLDGLAALRFVYKGRLVNIRAIRNAHRDFHKSIPVLIEKRKAIKSLSVPFATDHLMNKSIVFEFYIRKIKAFRSLSTVN